MTVQRLWGKVRLARGNDWRFVVVRTRDDRMMVGVNSHFEVDGLPSFRLLANVD
jgi:hypothetical protein